MSVRTKLIFFVILVMTAVSTVITAVTIRLLYSAAFAEEKARLVEIVKSQARLIEAVARFDAQFSQLDHPAGARAATLQQLKEAHKHYEGFGETGEFTLAHRDGDLMVWEFSHRHSQLQSPEPVRFDSHLAAPMKRALEHQSGTMVGLDYRGQTVLAAYEPVAELDLGIVAKIDLVEVRAPFVHAGILAGFGALALITIGIGLAIRTTNPILRCLENSESQHRAILASAVDPIFITDSLGIIQSVSKSIKRILDYEPAELIGKNVNLLIPPEDQADYNDKMDQFRRTGQLSMFGAARELEAIAKDGKRLSIELSLSKVDIPDNPRLLVTGVIHDLTDRKQSEKSLRESEGRFRTILENVELIAVMLDTNGDIVFCNDYLLGLTGRSKNEVLGKNWFSIFVPDEYLPKAFEIFQESIDQGILRSHFESEILAKDQSRKLVVWNNTILKDSGGKILSYTGLGVDITDQRSNEVELSRHRQKLQEIISQRTAQLEASHEQLRVADRLASIGTLAAGLGHDMNNVLFPMHCRLDTLQDKLVDKDATRQVQAIRSAVDYLQKLTDGLHLLALDPDELAAPSESVELSQWWKQAGPLLSKALPKHVKLTTQWPDDLPAIAIPSHRLTQAILNLLVNAGEAVEQNGQVQISAACNDKNNNIELAVMDNGFGMAPQVKNRALDPFFTTKKRGLGTGLGLSLVQGVVQEAGGTLHIQSAPDEGTTITLLLPTIPDPFFDATKTRPIARVTIADQRIASLVQTCLSAAGIEVSHNGESSKAGNYDVWVTDPSLGTIQEAQELMGGSSTQILVLGEAPSQWADLGASIITDPQDFEQVRRCIDEAASKLKGGQS